MFISSHSSTRARPRKTLPGFRSRILCTVAAMTLLCASPLMAQTGTVPPTPDLKAMPWMDKTLDADQRAKLVLAKMTQAEKLQLVHGSNWSARRDLRSNGGAGFVPGIERLGLPDVNMADSTVGVTRGAAKGRYSTLMPSSVAEAASWSTEIARDYGTLIGVELSAQGYNASLAGGVNLMREPRNGRTFEYRGEDPILAGVMAGAFVKALQAEHIIGDIKHYAANDQEIGRQVANVVMDERTARESDLLAFEIGIRISQPGMVMCAYQLYNGDHACESDFLLNKTLKKDWGFKGFVVSDWGATHSTKKALMSGLDQEQPIDEFFGDALLKAIEAGEVPQSRLDDAVFRIVRTMFAVGIVDNPPKRMVVDVDAGRELSQRVAEEGSVLLKNEGVLPVAKTARRILLIGSHADVGTLTGGGSGQVDPPGGNAVKGDESAVNLGAAGIFSRAPVWYPSSPLKALRKQFPEANVTYDSGEDPTKAAGLAKAADIVFVFANQPSSEGRDHADLSLPNNQDALISAVAGSNKQTVVILETGGPVTMPWIDSVSGVIAAWYPGARGAEAIARLVSGEVNFTGKLPLTFPKSESDLPNPVVPGSTLKEENLVDASGKPMTWLGRPLKSVPRFEIIYPEGANVGYRWWELRGLKPLFGFGHGLSYTTYAYSGLSVARDRVRFTVKNTGLVEGTEIAQVYARRPGKVDGGTRRLVGWARVSLKPGESRPVEVVIDPLYISTFSADKSKWVLTSGTYSFSVGGSFADTPLVGEVRIKSK